MTKRNPNLLRVAEYPEPPPCECGCGERVSESTRQQGQWNRFVIGHQTRGRVLSAESRAKISYARSQIKGEQSPSWKGGRRIGYYGYIDIFRPDHPRARGNGYVFEHILVAEAKIGRSLLPEEVVHHHDRNKQNNSPDNLEVIFREQHSRIHARKPEGLILKCMVCGTEFYAKKSHKNIRKTCGFECARELFREYYTGRPRGYHTTEQEKQEALERVKHRRAHRQVG